VQSGVVVLNLREVARKGKGGHVLSCKKTATEHKDYNRAQRIPGNVYDRV